MKYLFYLILASFLALAACGNEESKEKDKKAETTKKEKKQDKQKKSDDKNEKKEDKSKEDKQQNEQVDNVQQNNKQQETTVKQQYGQEQQQYQQESNHVPQQQEPSYEEQMRANAEVAKQHVYTGIPNGDAGMIDYEEVDRILEENRNVDDSDVGEMLTPEEEEAIMEQHERELEEELK